MTRIQGKPPTEPASRVNGAARPVAIAPRLLAWFDRHARALPWRRTRSPYRTLVSEFMLQQTVVATVIPYFEAFVARWPDLRALARASEEQVLAAWSGLGYYSRARNLHRAAGAVVERHGGVVPADQAALRALPGIGPYTAAAIAAIAFDQPAFALDGNAARVLARLGAIREPIDRPATRARLQVAGEALIPRQRAGAFAEAVMELGAMVCTPRAPACEACPLATSCEARRLGLGDEVPVKSPPRPKRPVSAVCARVHRGREVLLIRRARGLLAGTWTLPTVERAPGRVNSPSGEALASQAAVALASGVAPPSRLVFAGEVRHVFTHRDLVAEVYDVFPPRAGYRVTEGPDVRWADPAALETMAVSSLLRKLLAAGGAATPGPSARVGRGKATRTANGRRNAS